VVRLGTAEFFPFQSPFQGGFSGSLHSDDNAGVPAQHPG
jgi:hypothetical protein